ncbi:Nuclear transcription factor Y subunit alpha [Triplophysa tibetana]|uniref:Nuclear transcription factor Y subunit n=1 Tax=Triplophysa tibetana TaxID=1572043 RepID=A0A5A9NEX9_9TELE|nr:Nuclear transcription factor Y subunit alpha [Triplophysa tibetana]
MEYTTATTSSGEQIVVQTSNGQIQQQGTVTEVQWQTEPQVGQMQPNRFFRFKASLLWYKSVGVSLSPLWTAYNGTGDGRAGSNHHAATCIRYSGLQQIQLVQPGQIQLSNGQTLQLQGQQGQTQQIIIQQPQTAVTAGQNQGQQQITVQGQQLAQTAEGQTIVYQPVNADGTILQQGMFTIPTASLAGAQLVSTGSGTNGTNNGQGTVTVTLPMAGNMVNTGGMVMKYLHESRHRHAMARKRGDGGRFFSPKEKEEMALQAMKVSEGLSSVLTGKPPLPRPWGNLETVFHPIPARISARDCNGRVHPN